MSGTDASWPPRLEPTALLDALKVAVIVTDLSGTIVECNRQAEALFHCPRVVVGVASSSFTPYDLSPDLIAEIARALNEGETWKATSRFAALGRDRDGARPRLRAPRRSGSSPWRR